MSVMVCIPTTRDIDCRTTEAAFAICANHPDGASFRVVQAHPVTLTGVAVEAVELFGMEPLMTWRLKPLNPGVGHVCIHQVQILQLREATQVLESSIRHIGIDQFKSVQVRETA